MMLVLMKGKNMQVEDIAFAIAIEQDTYTGTRKYIRRNQAPRRRTFYPPTCHQPVLTMALTSEPIDAARSVTHTVLESQEVA
jgi:hypothetical protein